jgi:hypothetical protein
MSSKYAATSQRSLAAITRKGSTFTLGTTTGTPIYDPATDTWSGSTSALATGRAVQIAIQFGSELTGSPGQPVDTGNLRNAWIRENPSENVSIVSTNVEYAQSIEDGIGPHGPLTLRSAVGGFHSVALTVAGFDRIVDAAVRAQQ